MKTTGRLAAVIFSALMLLGVAPLASAGASPTLTISSPANGSVVSSRSVSVAGTTSDSADPVMLSIDGHAVETVTPVGSGWSAGPVTLPSDGEYALEAEQAEQAEPSEPPASVEASIFVNTEPPGVSIFSPSINHESVSFSGHAGDDPGDSSEVVLKVYDEGAAENEPLQVSHITRNGNEWHSEAVSLPPGGYYVRVLQEGASPGVAGSSTRTFTITSHAPTVTLSTSAFAKQNGTFVTTSSAPAFSTEPLSEAMSVTLRLYAGTAITPEPLESVAMSGSGGVWSAVANQPLANGLYTAQAEVEDLMGATGVSSPVIFSVQVPSPTSPTPTPTPTSSPPSVTPSPPVASFTWVPANPTIGQSVSLVSNSTDPSSAIDAFAWDPTGSGAFVAGGPAMTISFATTGPHLVHLRVVDGNGLSSVATQTIDVGAAPVSLMQPFPIVRIAGTLTGSGARVKLLTVQAPLSAVVAVSCKGQGCPKKSESRVAIASSKSKTVAALLTFSHFERSLRAGAVLQIRVSKRGEIGKFTSFTIRRHKLPLRSDSCLRPTSSTPITCPTS